DVNGADTHFRHLIDLVLDINPSDKFRALINADVGLQSVVAGTLPIDPAATLAKWIGANAALAVKPNDKFSVALRGGFYKDFEGFTTATNQNVSLVDGTLTLGYNPTPNLFLKLDQRLDWSDLSIFAKGLNDTSKVQVTTTLGVVATTN